MPIEFEIHKATEEDLDDLLRLNRALFVYERENEFAQTYDIDWATREDGRKAFRSFVDKPNYVAWLATNTEGKSVGYIAGFYAEITYRIPSIVAEIEMLFIQEDYRCSGIGRELVDTFKKWAIDNGSGIIRVGALAKNKHARDFYEKWGFAEHEMLYETKV